MSGCDLAYDQIKVFLTLPGKKVLIAKRQHPFILIQNIALSILSTLLVFGLLGYISFILFNSWQLILTSVLITTELILILLTKVFSDWYYHIYVITNRKIMEIITVPSSSNVINEVFLDQVRTTEVDTKINNFFGELINLGDVKISFDRPSHDEVFLIKNIYNPTTTGIYLGDLLE